MTQNSNFTKVACDTFPGPVEGVGSGLIRQGGGERKREGGPLFCYPNLENVYVCVAKIVH